MIEPIVQDAQFSVNDGRQGRAQNNTAWKNPPAARAAELQDLGTRRVTQTIETFHQTFSV
jgi:hypothetical protein